MADNSSEGTFNPSFDSNRIFKRFSQKTTPNRRPRAAKLQTYGKFHKEYPWKTGHLNSSMSRDIGIVVSDSLGSHLRTSFDPKSILLLIYLKFWLHFMFPMPKKWLPKFSWSWNENFSWNRNFRAIFPPKNLTIKSNFQKLQS